jgi:hypothetical protein
MLLGGLWHGAGWTFIVWGGLHGLYLVINHAWHALKRMAGLGCRIDSFASVATGRILTFLAVVVAWVFFRAESLPAAVAVLRGMCGLNGIDGTIRYIENSDLFSINWALGLVGLEQPPTLLITAVFTVLLAVVWIAPNTQQIMYRYRPALETYVGEVAPSRTLAWQPNALWAAGASALAVFALLNLHSVSEFLYFQF